MVPSPGWGFRLMTVLTLTTGTAFIMWLGEQITERGIGNGISLIIFAGIVVGLPGAILYSIDKVQTGAWNLLGFLLLIVVMVGVIAAVALALFGVVALRARTDDTAVVDSTISTEEDASVETTPSAEEATTGETVAPAGPQEVIAGAVTPEQEAAEEAEQEL